MPLWKWRARLAAKPMFDEQRAARDRLEQGPEDWLRWWRATGERELRSILMTAWDPVGVADEPDAWGEYDGYAPGIAHLLRDVVDADEAVAEVAAYLNHVERDFMGLTPDRRGTNEYLAASLVAWHEWSRRST